LLKCGINHKDVYMKASILALVVISAMLSGCLSVPGAFSPVQGPLSKQSPTPTYAATFSGILAGSISVVLDNGEICKGPWAIISNTPPGTSAIAVTLDMRAAWDTVYGTGYFTAHVLGSKIYARATLTGNMGTVLHTEFSNENDKRGNTKGVAQDDKGNVFKVSVYN
jgi:hypothetical protein